MVDPIIAYANIMRAEINRMNSIANNASNMHSSGFLQEKTSVNAQQFEKALTNNLEGSAYQVSMDPRLGPLKLTNRSLDIAMTTDSWFLLEDGGKKVVTRNGNFSLDEEGSLCIDSFKLVGSSGPISGLTANQFTLHADGTIFVNGIVKDKIKLVGLDTKAQLNSLGKGLYESSSDFKEIDNPKVVQGALISSNVDTQTDMTKLIEMSRHIEMLQRAMTTYSNVLDVGINQIGK